MLFRLVTYNIHKGIGGVDRRYRLDRIVDALARYEADIIFLQEVDDGVPRSSRDRQVDWLGDALDMPYRAYQKNVALKQGHYGNAILSKYFLNDVHNIDLTVPLKKRRRAILAKCILRNGRQRTVQLVNCHLGLAGYERVMQLLKILDAAAIQKLHTDTPTIIGGDYNDVWGTLGRRVMEPAGYRSAGVSIKTFPAIFPVRPLDRFYYKGDVNCGHSFPAHSDISRQASDHLPLVADFEIKD